MKPVIVFSSSEKYTQVAHRLLGDFLPDKYEVLEDNPARCIAQADFAERVALVVLDTAENSRYDAFEVIKMLKGRFKTAAIPVFVLASKDDTKARLTALSQNVNDYQAMPVSKKEVVLRCNNLIERYFERQSMHDGLKFLSGLGKDLKQLKADKVSIEHDLSNTIEAQQAVLELSWGEIKQKDSVLFAQEAVSEMSRQELMEANQRLKDTYESRLKAVQEKSELQMVFGKYIAPAVIEHLMHNDGLKNIAGEKKNIAIMFTDIRGFTAMTEAISPDKVVLILNEFFSELTEIIIKYNGIVDKYSGDNIMAIFGAPVETPDYVPSAFLAAVEMQKNFALIAKNWESFFGVRAGLGIGINCGEAIVGNIGSFHKLSYTAIGDVVNVAARFEQTALDGQILFGASAKPYVDTAFLASNSLAIEALGERPIKGKIGSHAVYNLKFGVD